MEQRCQGLVGRTTWNPVKKNKKKKKKIVRQDDALLMGVLASLTELEEAKLQPLVMQQPKSNHGAGLTVDSKKWRDFDV